MKKKVISLVLLVCFFSASLISPSYGSEVTGSTSSESLFEYTVRENSYEAYLEKFAQKPLPKGEILLAGGEYSASEGDIETLTSYEGLEGNIINTSDTGYVEWKFDVKEAGLYNIGLTYYPVEGKRSAIERELRIDGEIPFNEAGILSFSRLFEDKTDIKQDNRGNDIRPSQIEKPMWQTIALRDSEMLYEDPLKFYFEAGTHTIRLTAIKEPIIIQSIRLYQEEELKSYGEVSSAYTVEAYPKEEYSQVWQAEDTFLKSDATIFPLLDRSSSMTEPFEYDAIKLNIIGGNNWNKSGQWISWNISVPKDGYYKLGMKYRQNGSASIPATRALYIDGKQLFEEMKKIEFYYDMDWQMKLIGDGKDPYLFFLTEGEHEIKLMVTMGNVSDVINDTQQISTDLYSLYTRIVMLTGSKPDIYRDYQLEKKLPDMLTIMKDNAVLLGEKIQDLKRIAGKDINEANILEQLVYQLEDMEKDPDTVPARLKNLHDNISNLSTWLLSVRQKPLDMDYIVVASPDTKLPKVKMGFFQGLVFNVKSFVTSFFVDYNTIGNNYKGGETITVWAMMGRDQADTLKALIDEQFTPQTGININLSLINNENIMLFSAASGTGPDVALNISRYLPMDYGIRNALIDLDELDGFEEVKKLYADSAFIPYSYNEKVYGLPMTETFPMLFYRTDIMDKLGIKVPETWDELYKAIGLLQENNLQFAAGNPYDTMVLQSNGDYYNKDLTKVLLDSKEGINAFKKWTNLFTQYGLDIQYDFFNRFRTGEMPLGIADYTLYNQFVAAAPQIKGLWDMTLLPGTRKEDGTIDHTVAGNGTASVIFKNSQKVKESWEFLKWWMSVQVQSDFGKEIEAVLGTAARYNTATIDAVEYLDWPRDDYDIIMKQWSYIEEIPYIPGSYFVSRHINNAFNEVVINGAPARETIEKYVIEINKEIDKKLEELVE